MADEKKTDLEEEKKKGFFENETVKKVAIGVGVGAAVGVAAPVVVLGGLAATGFGAGGVVAGSVAAGIQSSIGSVAAGSLFASKPFINSIQNLVLSQYIYFKIVS